MPRRTKATLRDLRTTELWLQFYKERDAAHTKGLEHMRNVVESGAPAETVSHQLRQAIFEVDTALRVSVRMHELRMQELQTITKFPDEQ